MTKLLVVDDEKFQQDRIVRAAQQAEIQSIARAENLETALALLGREQFDLAVVDLNLGTSEWDETGIGLIAKLHELQPRCLIIAFTKSHDRAKGVRALEAGAADFISGRWDFVEWQELLAEKLSIYKDFLEREPVPT